MPIKIAKFGATDGGKTVGADACPAIPTSEAPGPWLHLGKIKSGQVEQVKKNVQIEGVNDATGMYETEDVTMVQQYKLKFTTQYIAPEVIQLALTVTASTRDARSLIPKDWLTPSAFSRRSRRGKNFIILFTWPLSPPIMRSSNMSWGLSRFPSMAAPIILTAQPDG